MCGLLAWVHQKEALDIERFVSALKLQTHRGPDFQKHLLWGRDSKDGALKLKDADGDSCLALGHNRLSIIDLTPDSNQPLFSETQREVLIFNGEIYNYKELGEELRQKGVRFRSKGDGEVLLQVLRHWGLPGLRRLNGMWAIIYFDQPNQRLVLSRDRFGKKPLFYYRDSNQFVVASEYKSIFSLLQSSKRKLSADYLQDFLNRGRWPTLPEGKTLYEGIYSLEPGCSLIYQINDHTLTFDKNNRFEGYALSPLNKYDLAQELESAVTLRLRSDVPIGITVSGGVDSSTVSAFAANLNSKTQNVTWYTASLSNDEKYRDNDQLFSRRLAEQLGIPLKEIKIPYGQENLSLLERMTHQYEIPLMISGNTLGSNWIYQSMSADGVRVALDGTGGDEIFGGYFRYWPWTVDRLLKTHHYGEALRWSTLGLTRGRMTMRTVARQWGKHILQRSATHPLIHYVTPEYRPLFQLSLESSQDQILSAQDPLAETQMRDIGHGKFQNYLYMNDQNSMMYSMEVRSPLLDFRLIKYLNLPATAKYGNGFNKVALRRAMPASLDDTLRWRWDKQGFRWKKEEFFQKNRDFIVNQLKSSRLLSSLFFMERLLKDWEGIELSRQSTLMNLFAITLLEKAYPCEVSPC